MDNVRAAGCSSGCGVAAIILLVTMERRERTSVNGENGVSVEVLGGQGKASGSKEDMNGGATWGSLFWKVGGGGASSTRSSFSTLTSNFSVFVVGSVRDMVGRDYTT